MGPVRIRHSSHNFGWQPSHAVDLAGWQAKMASIEIWIPWRNAHKPHSLFSSSTLTGFECLASLSRPVVSIELSLVFEGFERKNKLILFLNLVVFTDVQCFCRHRRPPVLCGETTHAKRIAIWSSSNLTSVVSSIGLTMTVEALGVWMFWQMPFETAKNRRPHHESSPRGTFSLLGEGRGGGGLQGWAPGRPSSHRPSLLWKLPVTSVFAKAVFQFNFS